METGLPRQDHKDSLVSEGTIDHCMSYKYLSFMKFTMF